MSMVTDTKDEAQERLRKFGPKLGVYRHYKGPLYVLFAVTLSEDELTPMAHYYSLEKCTKWTRTCENFSEDVDVPEGKAQRFSYERPCTPSELALTLGVQAVLMSGPSCREGDAEAVLRRAHHPGVKP